MIASRINTHVDLRGHVAVHAGAAAATHRVTMMGNHVIGLGFVALRANGIAIGNQLIAMWVMTVTADNPRLRHFALHK